MGLKRLMVDIEGNSRTVSINSKEQQEVEKELRDYRLQTIKYNVHYIEVLDNRINQKIIRYDITEYITRQYVDKDGHYVIEKPDVHEKYETSVRKLTDFQPTYMDKSFILRNKGYRYLR